MDDAAAFRFARALYRAAPLPSLWKARARAMAWRVAGRIPGGPSRRVKGLPPPQDPWPRTPEADLEMSVIMPVYGQAKLALAALDGLAAHGGGVAYETLVVDDASPMPQSQILAEGCAVRPVRLIRHEANQGFGAACNTGAAAARAPVLFFLNSDAFLRPNALAALLAALKAEPQAGMVGAKLLNPDGTLQEAGALLFEDGTAWRWGGGDDPNRPAYQFRRPVDYASAAAVAVRREVFAALHGFDPAFAPAYGEDADLCLRARGDGWTTLYEPLCELVHIEGATNGRDVAQGVKAYQPKHQALLARRHRDVLTPFGPPPPRADLAAGADRDPADPSRGRARVLVVDQHPPDPDRDAGSRFTLALMQAITACGQRPVFWAESAPRGAVARQDLWSAAGVEAHAAPYAPAFGALLKREAPGLAAAVLFRADVAEGRLARIRRRAPKATIVFHPADLHHLRLAREAEATGSKAAARAARAYEARERRLCAAADHVMVHSDVEAQLIRSWPEAAPVTVLPWIETLRDPGPPFDARPPQAVFLGNYRHPPNVDAARFLAREIWPLARVRIPEARLILAGAAMGPELRDLGALPGIEARGWVKDLSSLFVECRAMAAPLRYGAGIKGKLIDALVHGLPVATTPMGAEGLALADGLTARIAGDAQAFAEALADLLSDAALWGRIAAAGRAHAAARYGPEAAQAVWRETLNLNTVIL